MLRSGVVFSKFTFAVVLCCLSVLTASSLQAQTESDQATDPLQEKASVLVVRGGHPYETPAFENMCKELEGVTCDLVLTAHFETMSAKEIDEKYDALLFLNQNKKYTTTKRNRQRYMDLADLGVGMVFLHFTLSSEPEWKEYHDLVGGKWFLRRFEKNKDLLSTYFVDLEVDVNVVDAEHPTTQGLSDFTMTDTFYGKIRIESDVKPLLGTDHPDVAKTVAWTHKYKNSNVIYLMPGYTAKAYDHPSYRKFLSSSLRWVGSDDDAK